MKSYDWPENARELSNVLERVASSLERDTIYPFGLPFHFTGEAKGRLNPFELR